MDTEPGEPAPVKHNGIPGEIVDGHYDIVIGDYAITCYWATIRSLKDNASYTFEPDYVVIQRYLRKRKEREERQFKIEHRARGLR